MFFRKFRLNILIRENLPYVFSIDLLLQAWREWFIMAGDRRLPVQQWIQRGPRPLQEGDRHAGGGRQKVLRTPREEMDLGH